MVGLGGKLLIVISAPTVLKVNPCDVFGGEVGYGSKERSKGRSEGRKGGKVVARCPMWMEFRGTSVVRRVKDKEGIGIILMNIYFGLP
jgi:hypothetical protein